MKVININSFEDIKAWQKARELTDLIYKFTKKSEFSRDFALVGQITRASVSIMSNIAEGFEGQSRADFSRFLFHAKKSSGEVRCQLYIASDQRYITKQEFLEATGLSLEVSKMIANFIKYLNTKK